MKAEPKLYMQIGFAKTKKVAVDTANFILGSLLAAQSKQKIAPDQRESADNTERNVRYNTLPKM